MRARREEDSLKVKELYRKIFLLDKDEMQESAKIESVVAAVSGEKSGTEVSTNNDDIYYVATLTLLINDCAFSQNELCKTPIDWFPLYKKDTKCKDFVEK